MKTHPKTNLRLRRRLRGRQEGRRGCARACHSPQIVGRDRRGVRVIRSRRSSSLGRLCPKIPLSLPRRMMVRMLNPLRTPFRNPKIPPPGRREPLRLTVPLVRTVPASSLTQRQGDSLRLETDQTIRRHSVPLCEIISTCVDIDVTCSPASHLGGVMWRDFYVVYFPQRVLCHNT